MPSASTTGDHGQMTTSQHCDNRPQTNISQTTEQNIAESHTSPSPSTKKGSFFKKNVEDGMDRYIFLIYYINTVILIGSFCIRLSLIICIIL